ncbi:uncharacterized protein LOC105168581 [Sesamum indicum]|uniref:Uncharacterized protein LOC105168581 n=1 Tax=Sesamum indicum TaxID=4182 RepID=A0A6I9TQT8_SESIN|nr:uncharacterized protein LOC105168581 [Sesamum indicum]
MALIMKISGVDDGEKVKQQFNHFSHRHPLELSQLHQEDKAICSGCELDILGSAYVCTKPNCTFLLHDFCFDLPRRIRHYSHPKHPLGLSFSPPYNDGEFTCDACGHSGHAFTYHCGTCKFDLHVECAALPEVENRRDHEHPLVLSCGSPEGSAAEFVCYVCSGCIGKGCWMYCCLACNCGAHLECAGIASQ